ncbi:MAG TPA: tetratricopeptide repeat protein [Rhodothermales bacterium]|nr:tetratricopeptide repeat protein [Rhodothermales bacterium]
MSAVVGLLKGALAALCVFSCLLGTRPAAAQSARPFLVRTGSAEDLVQQGRTLLLQLRLGEAERIFRRVAQEPGGAPAAFHHLALSSMLKFVMTDSDAYYDEFFSRSDSLQDALEQAPEGVWRDYLDAEDQLNRMVVYAKKGSLFHAALAARAAYGRAGTVVKEDPKFYEAYKCMGLLHLGIGLLPSTYRKILSVLGYGGDVEQGLRELRVAAAKSAYNREESLVLLGLVDGVVYDEPEKAVPVFRKLYEENHQSPLFAFFYGYMLLKTREADTARQVLQKAVQKDERSGYFFLDYNEFHLADALFKKNRFLEAEHYFKRYVEHHHGPALKAPAYLELGQALEMQGRREEALTYYGQVESTRGLDADEVAEREAKRLIARVMTPAERQLLLASNAFGAGDYAQTRHLLRELWASPALTTDERAETAYRLGRLYQVQGDATEAIAQFTLAVQYSTDPEARWAPWAHFYIGQIYADAGRKELAAQAYRAALEYKGKYDYYQALEQSAKAGLKRLE